jgi:hypothetical protein
MRHDPHDTRTCPARLHRHRLTQFGRLAKEGSRPPGDLLEGRHRGRGAQRQDPSQRGYGQADFKNLWAALGKRGEIPDIDFERAFVVVQTSGDRILSIDFEVDDEGNLTGGKGTAAELKGGGFSYFVGVFLREGVKSYDGRAIKAAR